jgi:hypothetical protein
VLAEAGLAEMVEAVPLESPPRTPRRDRVRRRLPAAVGLASGVVLRDEPRLGARGGLQEDDLHSWVVLRTPRSPDRRPFDHFVDF